MKLFVDDLRHPPDATWTVARTSAETLEILQSGAQADELSLDHDLGPETVRVHSANPVGVEWLEGMIDRYGPGVVR